MPEDWQLRIAKENEHLRPGPDCAPDEALARMASGTEEGWMEHVISCDWCGERLRLLVESRNDALSREDQDLLTRVSPERPRVVPLVRRRVVRWGIGLAASLLLCAGAAWWFWQQSPQRAEGLLAEAYSEERSFAWQLPGRHWRDATLERGTGSRSLSLLEAEALLKRRENRAAESAYWLDLKGRAEMIGWQPEAAVKDLTQALALAPNSEEILTDLGVAYALRAEATGGNSDYPKSVNELTRALEIKDTPRARFNRALTFEKLGMVDQAIDDLQKYIGKEKDAAWRQEAQKRLRGLSDLRERRSGMLKTTPWSDVALEFAAIEWLAGDRATAAKVGDQLERVYGDTWLRDAEREPVDSKLLLRAAATGSAGTAAESLEASKAAAEEYGRRGAKAHEFRARLAMTFALNRLSESQACVREARVLIDRLGGMHYHWIRIMARMYLGSCLDMAGEPGPALDAYQTALAEARRCHMEGLELRAVGVIVNARTDGGDIWAAWQENRDAVLRLAGTAYSPNRLQQCLVNYSASAERRGWLAASAVFMIAAADVVAATGNRPTEAACRSSAASLAWKAGLVADAVRQSARSRELFGSLPPSKTRTLYLNSVALLEADSLVERGQAAKALRLLVPLEESVQLSQEKWQWEWLMGATLLRLRRPDEAAAHLMGAVKENEARVASLAEKSDRNQARREAQAAYRELARWHIERGEPDAALKTWMTAYSVSRPPNLIFLALEDGYACWEARGQAISYVRLRLSQRAVGERIRQLVESARTPATRIEDIRRRGRELYREILEPLGPQPREITILPDGNLASLPFALLVDEAGKWLASSHAIAVASDQSAATKIGRGSAVIAGNAISREGLPAIGEFAREEKAVRSVARDAVVLTGGNVTMARVSEALQGTELFHFVGHGFESAGAGGLFLSDGALTSESIRHLKLTRCRLAVLSACSTAAGESDGITNGNSLVRALLDAGAQSVAASFWPVESEATARLMEKFYAALGESAPAAALERASLAVSADSQYGHPYYWAAFQIYE